jgi:hypothetical protein
MTPHEFIPKPNKPRYCCACDRTRNGGNHK